MTCMGEFGDVRDRLKTMDGKAHCPVEDCEWWVPKGMEYMFLDHYTSHPQLQNND